MAMKITQTETVQLASIIPTSARLAATLKFRATPEVSDFLNGSEAFLTIADTLSEKRRKLSNLIGNASADSDSGSTTEAFSSGDNIYRRYSLGKVKGTHQRPIYLQRKPTLRPCKQALKVRKGVQDPRTWSGNGKHGLVYIRA